jgi:hypothetical protein
MLTREQEQNAKLQAQVATLQTRIKELEDQLALSRSRKPGLTQAFTRNFLGQSPDWYKLTLWRPAWPSAATPYGQPGIATARVRCRRGTSRAAGQPECPLPGALVHRQEGQRCAVRAGASFLVASLSTTATSRRWPATNLPTLHRGLTRWCTTGPARSGPAKNSTASPGVPSGVLRCVPPSGGVVQSMSQPRS